MTTCEGKNITDDKGKAKISQEIGTAQAAKDDEDNNEDTIDSVTEGGDVSPKHQNSEAKDEIDLLTLGGYVLPLHLERRHHRG